MRFRDTNFFFYEYDFFKGSTLDSLFRDWRDSSHALKNISGLADLRETLLIQNEFMEQYPIVSWKELRHSRGENPITKDELYHESVNARKEFNRVVGMHTWAKQSVASRELLKTGINLKQTLTLTTGLLQLYKADYWPRVGDEAFYLGRLWDVGQVYADPVDFFQNSGVPCFISIDLALLHAGDDDAPSSSLSLRTKYVEPAFEPA